MSASLATSSQAREVGAGYELRYRLVRTDGQVREMLSRVRGELDDQGSVTRMTGHDPGRHLPE